MSPDPPRFTDDAIERAGRPLAEELIAAAAGRRGLARYQRGPMIGEGAMAEVYEATDRQLGRTVALKFPKASLLVNPEALLRFEREARAAAQLVHPHIVALHDVGEEQGRPYLVMERIDGQPLNLILKGQRLDLETSVILLEKVARALHAVHGLGIIHRDLKPGNILVTHGGEPKISDFGLAHWMGTGGQGRTTVGTPMYMAPEQIEGRPEDVTPRSDVYSLGVILYELTTGCALFAAASTTELYGKILTEPPRAPRKANPAIPADLEAVILKAVARDPRARYASALDFAEDLARFRGNEPVAARPAGSLARSGRLAVRHRARLVGAALLGLLLVALAVTGAELRRRRAAQREQEEALGRLESERAVIDQAVDDLYVSNVDYEALKARVAASRRRIEDQVRSLPALATGHHLLGRAWELEGRDEPAEESWRKALELDPGLTRAHFTLGRLLIRKSFVKQVETRVTGMAGPGERWLEEARSHLGRAAARGTDLESGLQREVAETLILVTRDQPDLARDSARAGIDRHRGRRGEEEFQWLLSLVTKGEEQARALDRALEIRPVNPVALYFRGAVHAVAGRWDPAVADCRAALRINPTLDVAALNLACLLDAGGDREGALADLGRVIGRNPDSIVALTLRGRIRLEAGNAGEALADLDHALRVNPGFTRALAFRGIAYEHLERYDLALADLDRAVAQSVDEIPANRILLHLHRGIVHLQLKEFDRAIRDFDDLMRLDPRNPDGRLNRSQALGRRPSPDLRAAMDEVEEALRLGPPDWPSRATAEEWRAELATLMERTK